MKKAVILVCILLIPILFIVLNNRGSGKMPKDNMIFHKKLSDYGLFRGSLAELIPNSQGISYDLASPLFTDYAEKKRVIFLPPGKKMITTNGGVIEFPEGTIIAKTFFYPQKDSLQQLKQRLLETRLLILKEGQWNAVAYQWNSAQDEAFLLTDSALVAVSFLDAVGNQRKTNYIIPSRSDCIACHRQGNQILPIGPKVSNLNRRIRVGSDTVQQLAYWEGKGALERSAIKQLQSLPDYEDPNQPIDQRARAYLQMNCAHCHNPAGTAYMTMLDLRFETSMHETGIWLKQVKIISRMSTLGDMHMPQKGTTILHHEGIALIKEYLQSLK